MSSSRSGSFTLTASLALGAAILIHNSTAQALIIDDFSSGEFQGGSFNSFFQAYRAESTGTMLGGYRGTLSNFNDGYRASDGTFHYSSSIQYNARGEHDPRVQRQPGVRLYYGQSSAFSFPTTPFDLDDANDFDLLFPSVSDAFTLNITAFTFSGQTGSGIAAYRTTVRPSAGPVLVNIPLAQFNTTGPLDWGHINDLHFSFFNADDSTSPVEFLLDEIRTISIPEPTTLGLMLAGLVLLRLVRRSQRTTHRQNR